MRSGLGEETYLPACETDSQPASQQPTCAWGCCLPALLCGRTAVAAPRACPYTPTVTTHVSMCHVINHSLRAHITAPH